MSSDNTQEIARLKAAISQMLTKVPPSVLAAGLATTKAYKATVDKARKVVASNRSTLASVQAAYTSLSSHWS